LTSIPLRHAIELRAYLLLVNAVLEPNARGAMGLPGRTGR